MVYIKSFMVESLYLGWAGLAVLCKRQDESAFKHFHLWCGFFLPREVIIPDKRGRCLRRRIMETYWPSQIFTYNLFDNKAQPRPLSCVLQAPCLSKLHTNYKNTQISTSIDIGYSHLQILWVWCWHVVLIMLQSLCLFCWLSAAIRRRVRWNCFVPGDDCVWPRWISWQKLLTGFFVIVINLFH